MNGQTRRIRDLVAQMRQAPAFYINVVGGVLFTVEVQSHLPRVLRLVRRDLEDVDGTADRLQAGHVGVDTYDSFAISYHLPIPPLMASFGHRMVLDGEEITEIGSGRPRIAARIAFIARSLFLHLRSGVLTVSAEEQRLLISQLEAAELRQG